MKTREWKKLKEFRVSVKTGENTSYGFDLGYIENWEELVLLLNELSSPEKKEEDKGCVCNVDIKDRKLIAHPSFYNDMEKEGYNMSNVVKSKLIEKEEPTQGFSLKELKRIELLTRKTSDSVIIDRCLHDKVLILIERLLK